MQRIAQDWLVLQLTHNNGAALGITTGLQFLPMLLFGLWGGSFGDRFRKRRVLMVTATLMGCLSAVLGVLTVVGLVQVWEVLTIAFLMGMVTVVDNPTRQTFVPEMVGRESLTNAVSLNSATFNLARIAGPALAGVLIVAIGTGPLFFVNAVSFVGPILALGLMRARELRPVPRVPRERGQIRQGLEYVRHRPELILPMVVIAFVATFGMNLQVTTALFATDVFHGGAGTYGLLTTAVAVGSVAGALFSATRGRPSRRLLVGAALGFGALEATAAVMPTYPTFLLLLIPIGLASLVIITLANSTVQLERYRPDAGPGDVAVSAAIDGRSTHRGAVRWLGGRHAGSALVAAVRRLDLGLGDAVRGGPVLPVARSAAALAACAVSAGVGSGRPTPGPGGLVGRARVTAQRGRPAPDLVNGLKAGPMRSHVCRPAEIRKTPPASGAIQTASAGAAHQSARPDVVREDNGYRVRPEKAAGQSWRQPATFMLGLAAGLPPDSASGSADRRPGARRGGG